MQIRYCLECEKELPIFSAKNKKYCSDACTKKAYRKRNQIPKLCQGELFPYYTFLQTLKSYEIQELYRLERNKMKYRKDWHKIKQRMVILCWVYEKVKKIEVEAWLEESGDHMEVEIPAIDYYGE
ncbi:MAG: hypothetical protein DRO67_00950 [Candidatus Asgardarchaeum californiense]|nr:MAG: hypothetical protein DRO67_00950 [Candidatus Asgardarchaeum californiense]